MQIIFICSEDWERVVEFRKSSLDSDVTRGVQKNGGALSKLLPSNMAPSKMVNSSE